MAWQAHCSGNVGVGAVLTDSTGVIVATGRNRVLDAEAPPELCDVSEPPLR
jgi:tRNA(Arg) A34 adenosine deaminase TadA